MSFLKHKIAFAAALLSAAMAVSIVGNSLTYAFAQNYQSWKQSDPKWSDMHLGSSPDTVQDYGCTVTAAAILMVHSGSVTSNNFNPGVLVNYLNQNNGFSSAGLLNWWVLSNYTPDFYYVSDHDNLLHGKTQEEKTQEIQSFLDNGYYVMVRIMKKNISHFVAVDSIDGSTVRIMDPGKDADSLFDTYSAEDITQVRLFRGKNSTPEIIPETTELEQFLPPVDAPETAPVAPETLPPETSAESVLPETTSTSPETTVSTSTTTTSTTTIIETTTSTTPVTTTEITTTTSVETTDPVIYTHTDTTSTEESLTSETTTESIPEETEIPEPSSGTVEFVILEDAPETAPAFAGQSLPTSGKPKTRTIYVPEEQAEATLIELKNQKIFMSIRFIIKTDLNLRQNPDFDSDILTIIPAGTSLNVVEVNENFTWGRVSFDGADGWIALNFAEL